MSDTILIIISDVWIGRVLLDYYHIAILLVAFGCYMNNVPEKKSGSLEYINSYPLPELLIKFR